MSDELGDGRCGIDVLIERIEREPVLSLLNARMQGPVIPAEGYGVNVLALSAVAEQECAWIFSDFMVHLQTTDPLKITKNLY